MAGSLDNCSTLQFSFRNLSQSLVESLGKPSARMAVIQGIEVVLQALFLVKFARSHDLCVWQTCGPLNAVAPGQLSTAEELVS